MSSTAEPTAARTSLAGKYLTIVLDQEAYGLAVLRVREIIRLQKITPVPQLPSYVKGVINLRGKVIPVIDLRLKFGMPEVEASAHTCIVVVQVERAGRRVMLGIIVDHVSEVLNISAEEIERTPDFGETLDTQFMLGMAKVKGQVKILLDLDAILVADASYAAAA